VATNAVLERKGANVVLLTTQGFEDIIEIGRQTRSDIYDLNVDRPEPLVSGDVRIGIPERLNSDGNVLTDLTIPEKVRQLLQDTQPESIAVCYLFSFANPEHEERTKQLLTEAGVNTYWSLSSEVIPEYREYERFSTTVINAFVTPVMDRYLGTLEAKVDAEHLRIMQSNGGSMEASAARQQAVQTLLSGPAGGVVASHTIAKQCGIENVISFDMGGTSTDVSFLPGRINTTDESTIDELPVKLPMINIHTVGSGGGSIAHRDHAGVLQVGPESAGADPGPICYGKGGEKLTVTDANLLTGRLDAHSVFGDSIELNLDKTAAFAENLSEEFGISVNELCESILAVANAKMERAIRVISVEQGYDPAGASLIAFGGAGPLHGCSVATSLGIPEVVIPVHAGVFSAFGLLWADVVRDRTRTFIRRTPDIHWSEIEEEFSIMQKQVKSDVLSQGIADENLHFEWSIEMRYKGQSYEINIPWQDDMIEAFHQRHEEKYTFRHDDRSVEIVTLKVRGIGTVDKPELPVFGMHEAEIKPDDYSSQELVYENATYDAPVIQRESLSAGHYGAGPCVIPEQTSTTFIPPGWNFRVDEYKNLRIERTK
jgi:N-methylhydantoinase A